jgi:hypothetical protein
MCECYICFESVFCYESNGNVCFVIGVTIYSSTSKCMSVIYVPDQFFFCEFNGDVRFVIGITVCGNTNKWVSVIYVLELFFNMNSMVMSVL